MPQKLLAFWVGPSPEKDSTAVLKRLANLFPAVLGPVDSGWQALYDTEQKGVEM